MPSRSPRSTSFVKSILFVLLLALASLGASAGCFLPISTAAPQPARTVGRHEWGWSFSSEIPTLNLIAKDDTSTDSSGDLNSLEAPANSMNFGVAFGLTNHIDLEANVEGAMMAFVIPLPLGASAGLRAHLVHNELFDLALASRVGHLGLTDGSSSSSSSSGDDSDHADATYFTVSGVIQFNPGGSVRPSLALQTMPAYIDVDLSGEDPRSYKGAASSLTFSLEFVASSVSIIPFLAVTSFDSPDIDSARFVSGGIAFQHRPNWRTPPTPPVPAPPPPQVVAPPPPPPLAPPSAERPSTER
jgi:hypothetical protein